MKCELFNDNFQNFKRYNIPKAQLVIADIPYNIGDKFYGSNPMWYKGGFCKVQPCERMINVTKNYMADVAKMHGVECGRWR